MAATVYNGKGNITHSNSSGGNQRIVIYWIQKDNSAVVDVKWGNFSGNFNTATMNTNTDQFIGLNLAYSMLSGNPNSYGNNAGEKSFSGSSNVAGSPVPVEMFIADGESFSITTGAGAPITIIKGYNFIVIPESN
tara:strand:- start:101 stop:505 length:405 start_codon:yes stop_codon:yes gene_type:complete